MKIFITGGNGFIGSHVVRDLVARGADVRCLVRETSDTSRIDSYQWERFLGDVRDADSMIEGARGCDAIFHLASPSSWNDIKSPHMRSIIEDGTRNVLAAAREHGNIRVVYCSSVIGINGTDRPVMIDETSEFELEAPGMIYAQAKNQAELICDRAFEEHGQDVVTVNPAEVYGPEDLDLVTAGNLVDFAKSWPVLVTHGGTSVVHVDDVAAGMVAALDKGRAGERYILGGDNLTIKELASITLELLGQNKPIVRFPTPFINALTAFGNATGFPLPYNPLVVPYAVKYWLVDNSKARRELEVDFRPAREVLAPTLEWLRETGRI